MRRFWGFYQNESYSVGCSGASVYVFDKEGKELARFRDFPYAYSAAFMPGHDNILAVFPLLNKKDKNHTHRRTGRRFCLLARRQSVL